MYRCQQCQCLVPSKTRSYRKTILQRVAVYPARSQANKLRRWNFKEKRMKTDYVDDPGGIGLETVREIRVCSHCYTSSQST